MGGVTCPACSESIEAGVAKCPHCGEAPERWRAGGQDRDLEHLKKVATYQKGIIVAIVLYLLLVAGQGLVPQDLRWMVGLAALPVMVGATVCVFLLAIELYSTAVGVLLAVLTLVPCVGLIVLLLINSRASERLTSSGIRVGLLGADMSQV